MSLEEMLRLERDREADNPLADRTGEIVARVRRGRRVRAALGSVVGLATLVMVVGVAWQLLPPRQPDVVAGLAATSTTSADVRLLDDLPSDTPLDAGRYRMSVADAGEQPWSPVISVPAGYRPTGDGIGVHIGDLEPDGDGGLLWVWDIASVYSHPCAAGGRPELVGPSVAELADALAAQPMRAGTTPVPVSVGGYEGLYVEVSVPPDADVDQCPLGRFSSWPGRWQQFPGQVDMLWIVDVEGQRITFDASYGAVATPERVAELTDMVGTAVFTRADGA